MANARWGRTQELVIAQKSGCDFGRVESVPNVGWHVGQVANAQPVEACAKVPNVGQKLGCVGQPDNATLVKNYLRTHPTASDREIAQATGVPKSTVNYIRQKQKQGKTT
jgi:hypothetical protein